MAKRTYVATSRICGLEPPKTDKAGNVIKEHVLEAGDEYSMDESDAEQLVAGGSLVPKNSAQIPDADKVAAA